jgi:anti-anti-sigma factor
MLVCQDEKKKIIYVTPEGDLVADEVEALRRVIREYRQQGTVTLVLDLARVKAIDSMGIDSIIEVCNWLRQGGGELIIENASRYVKELMKQIRINGRLTISVTGWPC